MNENQPAWEVFADIRGCGPETRRSAYYRALSAAEAAAKYEADWPTRYVVEVKASDQTGGRYGLLCS